MKACKRHTDRARTGFTMMELLGVIAIIAIVAAVIFPAFSSIQKNLRMMQLDASAQQVYNTAQNRLSALQSNGQLTKLEAAMPTDNKLSSAPADYPGGNPSNWGSYDVYYIASDDSTTSSYLVTSAASLITSTSLQGKYIIEISPSTGEVYSVYYWESDAANEGTLTYDDVKNLRSRSERTPSLVGYYGGNAVSKAIVRSGNVDFKDAELKLINSEELYAEIVAPDFSKAVFDASKLAVTISVTGSSTGDSGADTTWSKTYSGSDLAVDSTTDTVDIILDSMRSGLDFSSITEGKIRAGANVTVNVSISYDGKTFNKDNRSGLHDQTTNSLFASYSDSAWPKTVGVSCVRHLSNLRDTAHQWSWKTSFNAITQTGDIDFNGNNWQSTSVSIQSRGKGAEGNGYNPLASFTPIVLEPNEFNATPSNSYDGGSHLLQNFAIGASSNADGTGLFSKVGITVSNVSMVNPKVTGYTADGGTTTPTGALVGTDVVGHLTNCHVYVDKTGADFNTYSVTGGDCTGGLIGKETGYNPIQNCSATINVSGAQYVGGLIGDAAGSVSPSNCSIGYDVDVPGKDNIVAVTGSSSYVGGFAGRYQSGGISDCKVLANVSGGADSTGQACVGGFIGALGPVGSNDVTNCSVNSYTDDDNNTASFVSVKATSDIYVAEYVGGFFGLLSGNNITNCNAMANVIGDQAVGGFAGGMTSGKVTSCGASGDTNLSDDAGVCTVTARWIEAGGFAGVQSGGEIDNSYAAMNVTCESDSQPNNQSYGGFVGVCRRGNIGSCYSSGDVRGGTYVGGFVGLLENNDPYITNCYSTSNVIASSDGGGFIGYCGASGKWLAGLRSYGRVSTLSGSTGSFGGFIGAASGSPSYASDCSYLMTPGYNDGLTTPTAQPAGLTYEQLTSNIDSAYKLSASDSHPYTNRLKGSDFPFACIVYNGAQLPHYGNWPAAVHITWKGGLDGQTVLQEYDTIYGSIPAYVGDVPKITKGNLVVATYTLSGWSPAIAVATEDRTYTAKYAESSLFTGLLAGNVGGTSGDTILWNYLSNSSRYNSKTGKTTKSPQIQMDSEARGGNVTSTANDINVYLGTLGYDVRQETVNGTTTALTNNSYCVYVVNGTFINSAFGTVGTTSSSVSGNFRVLIGAKIPAYVKGTDLRGTRYNVISYDVGRANSGLAAYQWGSIAIQYGGGDISKYPYYTYNTSSFWSDTDQTKTSASGTSTWYSTLGDALTAAGY